MYGTFCNWACLIFEFIRSFESSTSTLRPAALSLVTIAVTATKIGMDLTHLAYAIVTAANPETSTVTLALMYWMSWPL